MERWILEYDRDEEIYTELSADDAAIERVVGMFDGRHTFYCCLSATADGSCLWCSGEPDRRLMEGRLIVGTTVRHFILRHRIMGNRGDGPVRHGPDPNAVIEVTPPEIFSPAEVLSILRSFRDHGSIPGECEMVAGVRLFGANSFED